MPRKNTDTTSDLMTPDEVAALYRVSRRALDQWRQDRPPRGPQWIKLGDAVTSPVRYPRAAVMEFLAQREAQTTPR
jgi:predicted DNA-binding transcriptional regulator AlpA